MGLQTRERAAGAEAEAMDGRFGRQHHAGCSEMRRFCTLHLKLDVLQPRAGANVISDERCRQPDAGLVPLGKLQLCPSGQPHEDRRMRRGSPVVSLEKQHQRCLDSTLNLDHKAAIHHRN